MSGKRSTPHFPSLLIPWPPAERPHPGHMDEPAASCEADAAEHDEDAKRVRQAVVDSPDREESYPDENHCPRHIES
eukprot:CAMPEP_0170588920 /NCGR_PEP_ID=MMETSP0224-20130122/11085_1 /TAXON_ID=285029 /ORGANISM="Togula jolla, Strain CCCM 725" /LENGTH=75 /DNA_ID=CAMNT_0010912665 /DNA_START=352 /DNA_END=579 /DNA_ORIENTATION=+